MQRLFGFPALWWLATISKYGNFNYLSESALSTIEDMTSFIIIILFLGLAAFIKIYLNNRPTSKDNYAKVKKHDYTYKRKDFLMTNSENDFSKLLFKRFGNDYRIYPQIHLSSIIDHQVKGQNWKGALSHIDRKSVDFVICDKDRNRPLCAIELDDWSHESVAAKDKDALKESLLAMANLPLARIDNWRNLSEDEIYSSIDTKLPAKKA
jgi:very-short-patch-repair endonuclease